MRWDALFTDLELQLEAAEQAGLVEQVADLTRAERASVELVDRLHGGRGRVGIVLRGGERLTGDLVDAAGQWLLLADPPREHLVPVGAVVAVTGLALGSVPPGAVARRLGLGHALRAIARDRAVVQLLAGPLLLVGRVDAVGADHLEVAVVGPDRRPSGERYTVAFAAVERLTTT